MKINKEHEPTDAVVIPQKKTDETKKSRQMEKGNKTKYKTTRKINNNN